MAFQLGVFIGAIIGAVIFGWALSAIFDRLIVGKLIRDRYVAIYISLLVAFGFIALLGLIPVNQRAQAMAERPWIAYALGFAVAGFIRIKRHNRRLRKIESIPS